MFFERVAHSSTEQRLRIYRVCVSPALYYGLASVGMTAATLKMLVTAQAQHLRILLRVHEHGHTNKQVLARAEVCPLQALRKEASRQLDAINRDAGSATTLRRPERQRAADIQAELQQLTLDDTENFLTQVVASQIAPQDCPVCGPTFPTQASLHMHISSKHAELNVKSKIIFRREDHSLFGLPQCRFCRRSMYNWFSLEKHATQGACIRLKVGFAQGKTLPQILEEVKREEVQRPPVPPEDLPKQLQLSDLLEHEVFYSAIQDTPKHAGFLNEVGAQCLLCGQRVLQVIRLKTHWQRQHPKAWAAVKSQAASESKSMCATFSRPCAYCGSCAKDSRQHSGQCGVYFQAASMRFLLRENKLEPDLIGSKQVADKQHLHPPAYKAFQLEKNTHRMCFRSCA